MSGDSQESRELSEGRRSPGGGLVRLAVERPVAVAVAVILVCLFGILSVVDIPIQLTPDVTRPVLEVSTVWPGAAPAEVETELIEPQEEALKSLPNLKRMVSSARFGRASVELELNVGTSLDEALVRASNLLAQVPSYPENVDQPVLSTAGSNGPPIIVAIVTTTDDSSIRSHRTWVEETIVPAFQRIGGVATVAVRGGQMTEVVVEFDPREVASRGVSLTQVSAAVRGELRDISGGDFTVGKRRYLVRTPVAPDAAEELANVVLAHGDDGIPIRLGDVATVRMGLRKIEASVFSNGEPSIALLFFREAGSNILEVTEQVRNLALDLDENRFRPRNLQLEVVSDQTRYIYAALDLVQQNLLVGAFLAIIVLLLFLRSFAASGVVSIAIPVCIVGTALGMSLLGRTINVVSLAGMAFAVGMVVDNALVVLENIDTWWKKGYPVHVAAIKGTQEVWGAILASTLTTAAVFIPIISWQDEVGELLRDIAVAISMAVVASLLVSVLVIPSFSSRMLARGSRSKMPFEGLAARGARIRDAIARRVTAIVSRPARALSVAGVALGVAVVATWALIPPMEYLPKGNRNLIFGILVPPPGYAVEEMEAIGVGVQAQLLAHVDVEKDGVPALYRFFYVGAPERGFMGAVAKDPERVGGVAAFMRGIMGRIPDVFGIATQASLFGRGFGGSRSIELEVSGPDLKQLTGLTARMLGLVRKALPGAQVRPQPSLDAGAPEVRAVPNREQLARMGMNGSDLGLAVDALVDGAIIGEFSREGQPKLDVVLRAKGRGASDPAELAALPVGTPAGHVVPLGTLARMEEKLGPTTIRHVERRRSLSLDITPTEEQPLETAMTAIRTQVIQALRDEGAIPEDVYVELAGAAGDLEVAQARFAGVLALAVLITFLLLAALFEDFVAPLAVLVTVPLAAAGGIAGLRAVDLLLGRQPLDMMTSLGFVILIGVVVNNAILVVDGAVARIRDGLVLDEAVTDAVRRRVRPIFMSTLTSLAGLLPLVVIPGSGSELYRGVGAVVLGGLALSTVLTLFVVPAVFSLLWRVRTKVRAAPEVARDLDAAA